MVQLIVVPDLKEIFEVLAGLKRVFPAKILRCLKEHAYDLVLTDDPHQLYVADIEDQGNH